jgi:hypothetical protein
LAIGDWPSSKFVGFVSASDQGVVLSDSPCFRGVRHPQHNHAAVALNEGASQNELSLSIQLCQMLALKLDDCWVQGSVRHPAEKYDVLDDVMCLVTGIILGRHRTALRWLVPEGRLEIQEHAKLFGKNWHRDVAVKRYDLTVLQIKDVAIGRVHLPSGRGNYARRQIEIALVSAVESQFRPLPNMATNPGVSLVVAFEREYSLRV